VLTLETTVPISAVKTYMAHLYGYNIEWLSYYPHSHPLDFLLRQIWDGLVFQDDAYLGVLFGKVQEAAVTMYDYSRLASVLSWTYGGNNRWHVFVRDHTLAILAQHGDDILADPLCQLALLAHSRAPYDHLARIMRDR
jgi:hypothetical protein